MTTLNSAQPTIIEATPEPITIDAPRTAVIVVDMQNDFVSKGGMFDRAGVDISMVQKTIYPHEGSCWQRATRELESST